MEEVSLRLLPADHRLRHAPRFPRGRFPRGNCGKPLPLATTVGSRPSAGFAFDVCHVEWCDFAPRNLVEADLNLTAQLFASDFNDVYRFTKPCDQLATLLRREIRSGGFDFLKRAHAHYSTNRLLALQRRIPLAQCETFATTFP